MERPRDLRRRLVVAGVAVVISSSEAFLVACRKDAPRSTGEDAGVGTSSASATAEPAAAIGPDEGEAADAAGNVARGLEARAEEARRDAGTVDPACEGPVLSLLAAAVDPRCAVAEREWTELAHAAGEAAAGVPGTAGAGGTVGSAATPKGILRQQARREGDHVVLSIVNGGKAPVVVPLRYHPGHPELAFSVLAESEGRGVYELAPPSNAATAIESGGAGATTGTRARHPVRPDVLGELDAGATREHVHSARIRLPPGGVARARLTIDPRIVKRLDRTCTDAGARSLARGGDGGAAEECSPGRLPKGRVVLYVGQLVTALDAGEPARVEWEAP